jgi:hypothetical protein
LKPLNIGWINMVWTLLLMKHGEDALIVEDGVILILLYVIVVERKSEKVILKPLIIEYIVKNVM